MISVLFLLVTHLHFLLTTNYMITYTKIRGLSTIIKKASDGT